MYEKNTVIIIKIIIFYYYYIIILHYININDVILKVHLCKADVMSRFICINCAQKAFKTVLITEKHN